jgi:hypothetical protein
MTQPRTAHTPGEPLALHTRVAYGIPPRAGTVCSAILVNDRADSYGVRGDHETGPQTVLAAHQVNVLRLDLDAAANDLANNGIDGPDQPHNPRALTAMRTAEHLLAELTYRRAHPIDMDALRRALTPPPWGEPADGSLALVDERAVYQRIDDDGGAEIGTWWKVGADGTDEGYSRQLGEILGHDEPPEEREPHTFELLFTGDDVMRIVQQVIDARTRDEDYLAVLVDEYARHQADLD